MCRIAGIYDPSNLKIKEDLVMMRDTMKRGGPDDAGIYINQGLALGHVRLSIIDLSANGHQPMINNNLVLCFNGEIYNYQIIKTELQQLGYNFQTLTDSEVILKSFQEWGTDCFRKFNGMFALAIYDKETHQITLARDHAGIKPLYYNWSNGKLFFSSEIRALKTLNIFKENPNWRIYFLAFGHLPEPITTLSNVAPLEKGTYLTLSLKTGLSKKKKFSIL
jgi:asparagine synthase (glutamine-hydrolysing)